MFKPHRPQNFVLAGKIVEHRGQLNPCAKWLLFTDIGLLLAFVVLLLIATKEEFPHRPQNFAPSANLAPQLGFVQATIPGKMLE